MAVLLVGCGINRICPGLRYYDRQRGRGEEARSKRDGSNADLSLSTLLSSCFWLGGVDTLPLTDLSFFGVVS